MKTSKKLFSGLLIATAVVTVLSTSSAFAYQGDPNVQGPNYSAERHEAMTKAFETNNYATWKELMEGKGRVTEVINADNFAKFAEAHQLAKNGKLEEAKAIRAELGLGRRDGSGKGQGRSQGSGRYGRGNGGGAKDGSRGRGAGASPNA